MKNVMMSDTVNQLKKFILEHDSGEPHEDDYYQEIDDVIFDAESILADANFSSALRRNLRFDGDTKRLYLQSRQETALVSGEIYFFTSLHAQVLISFLKEAEKL